MGIALRPRTGVHRDIRASREVVWQLLIDVDQWPRWGPSVRRAALDDGGSQLRAGARGTVWTAVGAPLRFAITDFEPGSRWSWTVAGVAATGHEVTARPNGCRVSFTVPWWAVGYLPVCAVALTRIDRLATGQPQ